MGLLGEPYFWILYEKVFQDQGSKCCYLTKSTTNISSLYRKKSNVSGTLSMSGMEESTKIKKDHCEAIW